MSVEVTKEMELAIRQLLVSKLTYGDFRVIPAPYYFQDANDYWESINHVSPPTTAKEIELKHIQLCMISPRLPTDTLEGTQATSGHSPLMQLNYEFYIFSQYDLERENVNETVEHFLRQVLAKHDSFVEYILKIKSNFQGDIALGWPDPDGLLVRQQTTSLTPSEDIEDKVECEFIPGVEGHTARFFESVYIRFKEC